VSTLSFTIVNTAACPFVTYTPTNNSIEYSFTTESGTRTYTVELSDSGSGLPPAVQTFTTTSVQNITSVFAGLTSLTNYTARVTVTVNGVPTVCPITAVTTL
jgi:hypothetical protein